METHQNRIEDMELVGGDPALDFVNTLAGLLSTGPLLPADEHLLAYEDVLTFAVRSGTLSERAAGRLRRTARGDGAAAERALAAGRELRAHVEGVFRPISKGEPVDEAALAGLRAAGAVALERAELGPANGGYQWAWNPAPDDLEAPLWPVAHSAVELLTSPDLARLRGCGRCRWLFLDVSKNRSRRWCTMEGCGTDEKKERYVERRRARRASKK